MLAGIAGALIVVTAAASLLFIRSGINRMPADSARLTQLTYTGTVLQAELSPDGEFLAFVEGGEPARLMVKDLTDGCTIADGCDPTSGVETGPSKYSIGSAAAPRIETIDRPGIRLPLNIREHDSHPVMRNVDVPWAGGVW